MKTKALASYDQVRLATKRVSYYGSQKMIARCGAIGSSRGSVMAT